MTPFQSNSEQKIPKKEDSVYSPTLVIGIGNPILGDDGVGWRVAEQVRVHLDAIQDQDDLLAGFPIEVDCQALGGLSLMERMIGYKRAILIDAICTGQHPPGTVIGFPLEDLPKEASEHLNSAHDTTLQTAIAVGRSMDAELPEMIRVVGVECEITYDFSEILSAPVATAVPLALSLVLQLLREWAKLDKIGVPKNLEEFNPS